MFRSLVLAALILFLFPDISVAATIGQAHNRQGEAINGVIVEGDIEPGDTNKLWNEVSLNFGDASTVYLRSKGGNVEEAMNMGALIRRLRLGTEVPMNINGAIKGMVSPTNPDNNVCASA